MENEKFNKIFFLVRILFDTSVEKKYLFDEYSLAYNRKMFSPWQIEFLQKFEKISLNEVLNHSIDHKFGTNKLTLITDSSIIIHEDWKRLMLDFLISNNVTGFKEFYQIIINRNFELLPNYIYAVKREENKFIVCDRKTVYDFLRGKIENFDQVFKLLDFMSIGHIDSKTYDDVLSITGLKELSESKVKYDFTKFNEMGI